MLPLKNLVNKSFPLIFLALLAVSLSGCLPMFLASSTVVGRSIAEERSTGEQLDDNLIMVKIKDQYVQKDFSKLFEKVDVTVLEGRVLLNGSVVSATLQEKAGELAWKVKGVKEVINEIEVDGSHELGDHAKDIWLASSIRAKLLFSKDVHSVNFAVDVHNKIAYLLGIAQDQEELDMVVDIVSRVKGVDKVISHITLRNDPRRTAY